MSLPNFEYRAPQTVEQAIALRQEFGDDALVMSGGLTVMILLRERLVQPRVVISLAEIPALQGIDVSKRALRIGAEVTHSQIASSTEVRSVAPLLSEACSRVGSPAIRMTRGLTPNGVNSLARPRGVSALPFRHSGQGRSSIRMSPSTILSDVS